MSSSQEGQTWRVIVEHIDDIRSRINASCVHIESWQVASYTLSVVFLVLYIIELASSDRAVGDRIRSRIFHLLRTLPWVQRRLNEDLARAKKEIEEEVHQYDQSREFYKFIPERGLSREEIKTEAIHYHELGNKRRRIVTNEQGDEEKRKMKLVSEVASLFGNTNPRDSNTFPGSRKMESELVRMSLSLFHGGSDGLGIVVPSTAEATVIALSAARNASIRQGITNPCIVASSSASPSLFHAAKLLRMRVTVVQSKKDGSVEAGSIKRAISSDTAIIFVSAPNYSTGTMDPIDTIAKIAQRYHIYLHVDCSLGGFILPFLELCDYHIPSFDFRLPGVSSISIDFSRYSHCPSSIALTLFRDQQMMKGSIFSLPEWPGGIYSSPSLSDSLDGSAIAAAWSTLLATGKEGFVESTQKLVEATKKLALLLSEMDGITIIGSADTIIVAFETNRPHDIYHIIEVMRMKGWPLEPLLSPPAARIMMNIDLAEDNIIDSLIEDLDTALVQLHNNPHLGESSSIRAFHHLVATAPDRWLVRELASERALAHYSMPPVTDNRRTLRTLSVEGRKMSMITAHTELVERRKNLIDNDK